jgi:hypothetical protein
MRGKKTDTEFISSFISQSVEEGLFTTDDFIAKAKSMISSIDEEIKRVEKQKIIRSKLLDVISNFDQPDKSKRQEEAKILSFYQIEHPQICKIICKMLQTSALTFEQLMQNTELSNNSANVIFCLKQLAEHKVISKAGKHFLRSDKFESYLTFVFQENK